MPKARYQLALPADYAHPVLVEQLNDVLARISAELGQIQGFDGQTPTFYNSFDMQGKRICRVGLTRDEDDLPSRAELRERSVFRDASGMITARHKLHATAGMKLAPAKDLDDAPTLAQTLFLAGGGAGNVVTLSGSQTLTGTKTFDASLALTADSPSQITADQDNYTLGARVVQRLSTDASRTLTGILASANALKILYNIGSNDLVVKHEGTGSSAANRVLTQTGADVTLTADQAMLIWYDSVSSRWRQVN